MKRVKQRIYLTLLLCLFLALACIARWQQTSQPTEAIPQHLPSSGSTASDDFVEDTENTNVYLLIGATEMAGMAEIPERRGIERCSLLNQSKEWEPARSPLNRYSSIDPAAQLSVTHFFFIVFGCQIVIGRF